MHSEAESRYQQVMRSVYAGEKSAIEAETEEFGFDHTEVGELVLERWSLPQRLVGAVAGHHDLGRTEAFEGSKPLAAVLQVADGLCLQQGYGRREEDLELDPLACAGAAVLGIEAAELDELVSAFKEAYEREKELFG